MPSYKGMTPEAMYLYDNVFQLRAEDGIFEFARDNPLPVLTAPGELEVMHVIQRSISSARGRPRTMESAMQEYREQRRTTEIQGLRGEKLIWRQQ